MTEGDGELAPELVQRRECWHRAIHDFATADVFVRRARDYTFKLRILSYVGIGVPLSIGGLVLAFGMKITQLNFENILQFAGLVLLGQCLVAGWSLQAGWAEELQYALESVTENRELSERFRELGQNPPNDFDVAFAETKGKDNARRNSDIKRSISEKELRRGHRAALRQFGRACDACKLVPANMESTNCGVCGNFR